MVWLFIILTIATYSFVMKHVLSNIQKPAKAVKPYRESSVESQAAFNPTPTTR
ncbi:hypothetical protein SRABI96_01580 [Peribacillus sp. Bi96]|uniref:hypothetical protein n=1 Tax=Peribacillus sp. Bi96 TaxID=2884273 RepID=UPI001DC14113|nr:hypothetical protein [Peribacillus sp. Bi96]CAH0187103.1 hypothetical protein SRABI96_01580 [Peribacillus sp. Bi96]